MKRVFVLFLCAALLLAAIPASAEYPGNEVSVSFAVKTNKGQAITMTAKLEYDHDVLELITEKNIGKDDTINIYGISDVADSPLIVRFLIKRNAAPGSYPVTLQVLKATNYELEDVTTGLTFSRETVTVESRPDPTQAATAAPKKTVTLRAGDTFLFGTYPQTRSGSDSTPIEWIVLDVRGNKALLLSRFALDCKPYNDTYTNVTWETCGLREWLNGSFIDTAFTPAEQTGILTVTIDNSKAQGSVKWSTKGTNDTQDRAFLLSFTESYTYFKSNNERKCAPTDWAVSNGAYADNDYKADGRPAGWWWLRSPGQAYSNAATISRIGGYGSDANVNVSNIAVRPALWIDLGAGVF